MLLLTLVIFMLATESFSFPSYNRRQAAEDISFDCNSYSSVNQWINANRNDSAIFAKGHEITKDGRVSQSEALEIVEVWCSDYARVASELQIEAADCPNVDKIAIEGAMNHLGPACDRSGNVSNFIMDVLQDFTEITITPECNQQVFGTAMSCVNMNTQTSPGTQFIQDLMTVEENTRSSLKCAVDSLNTVTTCGSVKQGFVTVYLTSSRALLGVELKYADIF